MKLSDPVTAINGIGSKRAALFKKLDIDTIGSLLYHFPRIYFDYPDIMTDITSQFEESVAICARIIKKPITKRTRRINITTAYVESNYINITLIWFNLPYFSLDVSKEYVFYGKFKPDGMGLKMEQPMVFTKDRYYDLMSAPQPIYPLTKDLGNAVLTKAVKEIFCELNKDCIKEFLDEKFLEENNMPTVFEALKGIHMPCDFKELKRARKRLVFNEFFHFFLEINAGKEREESVKNTFKFNCDTLTEEAISKLPYELTVGQHKALGEIRDDLNGEYIRQRLIQADVGSGKTVISFLSMILCAENGYKSAIMAPTEVLASQHYATFKKFVADMELPFDVCLLTGKMSAAKKREVKKRLSDDAPCFIVGTHALIQEGVKIKDLALVVVDEQHRFGVKQRKMLSDKGGEPFSLVMSATPIPRSLAMILYSDMNISIIKDVPKKRLPIKNCVISENMRTKAYQFLIREVNAGHQCYIICPLVDKSEKSEAENVTEYTEKIKALFPKNIRISTLHGRMSADEKNAVMEDFVNNNTDILVSTTVIEVGIDVANATVMMIENAKRFGLSQLHQLRGRVGRGEYQSYCIFMDESEDEPDERLKVINSSNDGFYIANEDLRLRGPGEIYGLRQSGGLGFKLGDIYADSELLTLASKKAKEYANIKGLKQIEDELYQALPSWNNWYNI